MPDAPLGFQCRSVTASVRESQTAHAPIGHASDFTLQCNSRAKGACLVKIRCHFARVVSVLQHFHRVSTEHDVRDFLRNSSTVARIGSNARLATRAKKRKNRGSERPEGGITAPFMTFGRPASGKNGKDEHAFICRIE